jgi:CRP/FNR family transcriptional regulator, cyclic AMP receptor protein
MLEEGAGTGAPEGNGVGRCGAMGNPGSSTLGGRQRLARGLLGGRLSGGDLDALLAISRGIRVRRRTGLLRAQDDRAMLLLGGAAKAHLVTAHGDEVITAIHGPGDAPGLVVALGRAEVGSELTSLDQVDALSVAGPALRALLRERPGLTSVCLAALADQHAQALAERARFAGTSVAERVQWRLLELAQRWGRAQGPAVHVGLPITQEELAAWSGASRESVAKVLHELRATGLLLTGRRSLTILDLPRLRERCEPRLADPLQVLFDPPG